MEDKCLTYVPLELQKERIRKGGGRENILKDNNWVFSEIENASIFRLSKVNAFKTGQIKRNPISKHITVKSKEKIKDFKSRQGEKTGWLKKRNNLSNGFPFQ